MSHRESGLAFTDKYAVIGWNDTDGTTKGEMYITVYELADGRSSRIQVTNNLGVGDLSSLAVNGDYIIVGGSTATTVCKINTGSTVAIEPVAETTTTHGNQFSLIFTTDRIFSGSSRQANITLEIGHLDAVLVV